VTGTVRNGQGRCSDDGDRTSHRARAWLVPSAIDEVLRRRPWRGFAVLLVVLAGSLLGSAPALAISQRGHVFDFAFERGAGEGFTEPTGVAANNAGDVYVVEKSKGRVDEFEPVLEPGTGKLVGEKLIAELTVPSPEDVAVDDSTEAKSDPSIGDVYVTSNVTLKSEKEVHTIFKFGPEGKEVVPPLTTFAPTVKGQHKEKFAQLAGIAVDASGELFVHTIAPPEEASRTAVLKFNNAVSNQGLSALRNVFPEKPLPGLAVDAQGSHVYVVDGALPGENALQNKLLEIIRNEEQTLHAGFAVVAKLDDATGQILTPALDYEASNAVAVNPADNDAYLVNVIKNEAEGGLQSEVTSSVTAFGPQEEPIEQFSAPNPSLKEGGAIALDPATDAVYVVDRASGQVDVFEADQPGHPTVEGLSDEVSADGADTVTLSANVDPHGADTHYEFEYGSARCPSPSCTKTEPADIGEGFGDKHVPLELKGLEPGLYYYRVLATGHDGEVASGESTFTITAPVGRLPDARAWEMVSPPNKDGAEPEAISGSALEAGLIRASAEGGAISFVADGPMPAESEPEGLRSPNFSQIFATRNAQNHKWESQDITTPNDTGSGVFPGEPSEYWLFSSNLSLALVDPLPSYLDQFARPPLSPLVLPSENKGQQENTIYLRDDQPVQPQAAESETYEEARTNGEAMGNPGYVPLVDQENAPGAKAGSLASFGSTGKENGIVPEGGTPDLGHIVFRSEKAKPGLYEWELGPATEKAKVKEGFPAHKGISQLVSVPPGDTSENAPPTVFTEAHLGGLLHNQFGRAVSVSNAISTDGSLVFWTYVHGGVQHLEVRDMQLQETLQLDKVQSGAGEGAPNPEFQVASATGSKVYFTDTQRLTADSRAERIRPDLYVAEVEVVAGKLQSSVKDVTPVADEGANLQATHGLIGATEEEEGGHGSYVYFVADAALTPGATRGQCVNEKERLVELPAATTCNLYVSHQSGPKGQWETHLVAALSFEDEPDWAGVHGARGEMTSSVSASGRYIAFMSDRSLTGYDNEDASGKGRRDEEVYLYDAQNGVLACASCNPSGARPRGVFDPGHSFGGKGEGLGLVVDREETWSSREARSETLPADHWLAGSVPGWTDIGNNFAITQSRYLSNEGRLFFNSADALVPVAKPTREETVEGQEHLQVGVENVYEYELNGLGGCHSTGGCVGLISSGTSEHESALLEASASGDDVFFLTAESLAPEDTDSGYDVYDAHVCTSAPGCPGPPPPVKAKCEGEECQGSFSSQSLPEGPSNAPFSGSANLQVLHETVKELPKTAPGPTTAQKLAKALKTCRAKYKKNKHKRVACEKQAHKKYGPFKVSATKTSTAGAGR
jgi:DNA-binding beta-propeller fold protein YncE